MGRGEHTDMSPTFAKDEMIQAKEFRVLSQKALQHEIKAHEKIGILFPNEGLDAVMLSYEKYVALVNRITELEEIIEDIEIEKTLGGRIDTPLESWIEHPEGVSTLEMYRSIQGGKERIEP